MIGAIFFWIIVGGIAGFLAEKVMKADMGLLSNIILGIIGAFVGGWVAGLFGFNVSDNWIPSIITAFIGAVIVIAIYRAIRGRSVTG